VGKGLLAMPAKGFTPMLEQNFDVIHVFNAHTPLFLVALGADLPAVATPAWHGASESSLRNLVWKGVTPVVRHRLRGVHIQAASNAEAALITRDFGMTPELIMQGVDRRRRGEAIPGSVLTIGRLGPEKRTDRLIEAIGRVPEATLTIVGDGSERHALELLAEQLAPGRVIFAGRVTDVELDALWSTTSAYASASEFESYGIAVAEAISAGVPTACSDIPSHRELGATCVPEGIEAMASGIRAALQSPASESRPIPTWQDHTDALIDLYHTAIHSPTSQRTLTS